MDPRIERLQRQSARSPGVIAMGGGLPAIALFPRAAITRAFLSAIRVPTCPALQYDWPEGDASLREWIARRLVARGASVTKDDVIVTNGAQQAIGIAVDALVSPHSRVGVDRVSYPAALELLRRRGAELVRNPGRDLACTYVMPGVANPRGDRLSPTLRADLLAGEAPIIADEAYAELGFDGVVERPLLADARDRVWHVGTFSKTLCPGFRVGWLVPPPARAPAALLAKRDRDLQAGSLAQQVVRAFLAADDFDARLARARAFYARRAEHLLRALRRELPGWRAMDPLGGFSIFIETDLEGDESRLLAAAVRRGVSFDPGSLFRLDEGARPIAMRLCFSATGARGLEAGVARLARAVRDVSSPRCMIPSCSLPDLDTGIAETRKDARARLRRGAIASRTGSAAARLPRVG